MNQPQEKSNSTKILEEALGQHIKMQNLIIKMEGDSAMIASMAENCQCRPDEMKVGRTTWQDSQSFGIYRLCLNCGFWISPRHMDDYNRAFGFSGYDEEFDHDDERIFDNES